MHAQWKDQGLRGQNLLVLLSGGPDSVALLHVARELSGPLGFRLGAGHVHHGPGPNEPFRDRALGFCRELCRTWEIPFLEARSSNELGSELQLRKFRRVQALRWKQEGDFQRLLVAHHAQDLLETRFFRLMRGTGPQGLPAMKAWAEPWWRPFLAESREEILRHLHRHACPFLQDPSNRDLAPMRNWIRHDLFPRIEAKRAGSLRNLARSLERLSEQFDHMQENSMSSGAQGLSRAWFLTLNATQQKQALAQYLWSLGLRDFRHTHLEEIRKRLDNPQKTHRFSLAGCNWHLNAGQILAVPKA